MRPGEEFSFAGLGFLYFKFLIMEIIRNSNGNNGKYKVTIMKKMHVFIKQIRNKADKDILKTCKVLLSNFVQANA